MFKQIKAVLFLFTISSLILSGKPSNNKQNGDQKSNLDSLKSVFVNNYDTVQTSVYWYWISDHLSKEGVVKDLQAMKSVGINRAFIGNIGLEGIPFGDVKIFSEEWWDILHTALKTASELDIDIGIFNSPGWSQSGGPWIQPQQSMRYLHSTDTLIEGGKLFEGKVFQVPDNFQHVKTLAFNVEKDYNSYLQKHQLAKVSSKPNFSAIEKLFEEGNDHAIIFNQEQGDVEISLNLFEKETYRSLTFIPHPTDGYFKGKIEVLIDGEYQEIRSFEFDRRNTTFNVGFEKYAPVTISFPAVSGDKFKLVISNIESTPGIKQIKLSAQPRIEYYKEKTLAKMHPTPSPSWDSYLWRPQAEDEMDLSYYINSEKVIDITDFISKDGEFLWEAPDGYWKIIHTGMVPTGVTNGPATKEGTGLEVDKMNHKHVVEHFEAFLGEIKRRIPKEDRRTWKVAVQDSYETGSQNWTDDFIDAFAEKYGYDPVPFMPAMFGYVIDSKEKSDRFLWDLRRFIADRIAYEYVGGLREISHQNDLTIWLENYGHWGFPGEFLQYGGQSDEIGGEFWNEGELGDIENRAASSAAHIYGKRKVSAESFTSSGNTYRRYPALLKARADRFFTEGINSTLLHVYIHQPYEDKKPGVNTWFGTEFNRHNTWFYFMDDFISYLKRCNFILQQGKYVADVAYFIGEDVPKMTGVQDPVLPDGYSFDFINAEVIMNRLDVLDGNFILPDGMQYRVLVLPELQSMRPELLKKIEKLVEKGGVVVGPRPIKSPSLSNYPRADHVVQKIANRLWGSYGEGNEVVSVGAGKVFDVRSLDYVFDRMNILPDFRSDEDSILFIHRVLYDSDVYFVSNQNSSQVNFSAKLRSTALDVERWNPVNGKIERIPFSISEDGRVEVNLNLDIHESCFIVLKNKQEGGRNIKEALTERGKNHLRSFSFQDPWKVTFFDNKDVHYEWSRLEDWAKSQNPLVKYYSGKATYSNTFNFSGLNQDLEVKLNLGKVKAIGKVRVNGKYVGGVWTYPYSLDITEFLKNGENFIEIDVVNTWVNALIGDKHRNAEQNQLWLLEDPYNAESELHEAGIIGPVAIELYQ